MLACRSGLREQMAISENICYLCGEALTEISADHVPPRQFYAPPLRVAVNFDRLVTVPAHQACQGAYSMDEEYFTRQLAPLAAGTTAANALNNYNADRFLRGIKVPLTKQILGSFEARPSGLHLPGGKILVRVNGARIRRVIWKLTRGLHFIETGKFLPIATRYNAELLVPEATVDPEFAELWEAVKAAEEKGAYKGVFAYKYRRFEAEGTVIHGWAMLVWDRIMLYVVHPDSETRESEGVATTPATPPGTPGPPAP